MKTKLSILFLALTTLISTGVFAKDSSGLIMQTETPNINAPCYYFTLDGVTEADPSKPGSPWFSIPKNHVGYRELVSTLMMAQVTKKTVMVRTTGTSDACGSASVNFVRTYN